MPAVRKFRCETYSGASVRFLRASARRPSEPFCKKSWFCGFQLVRPVSFPSLPVRVAWFDCTISTIVNLRRWTTVWTLAQAVLWPCSMQEYREIFISSVRFVPCSLRHAVCNFPVSSPFEGQMCKALCRN
ncbi:unnamed protein product [Symbiodinium necroappetens]|uniref:Uncharacterized protein n=1 Tax=Symbiodinium necroappetens TaxID=1628268 RepID=A0A813C8U1_9DINO|nr:unnamed protein product [Symbiodinium necroappetens]